MSMFEKLNAELQALSKKNNDGADDELSLEACYLYHSGEINEDLDQGFSSQLFFRVDGSGAEYYIFLSDSEPDGYKILDNFEKADEYLGKYHHELSAKNAEGDTTSTEQFVALFNAALSCAYEELDDDMIEECKERVGSDVTIKEGFICNEDVGNQHLPFASVKVIETHIIDTEFDDNTFTFDGDEDEIDSLGALVDKAWEHAFEERDEQAAVAIAGL